MARDLGVSRRQLLFKAAAVSVGGSIFGASVSRAATVSGGSGLFADKAVVSATIGEAVRGCVESEGFVPVFGQEQVSLGIFLSDPQVSMSLKIRDRGENVVRLDAPDGGVDAGVALTAGVAHRLLSGQTNLARANGAGELSLIGDRRAVVALVCLPGLARERYRENLKLNGQSRLLGDFDFGGVSV